MSFVQKSQTGWNLQYTHDEKFCARAVSNEIQFWESHRMDTVWGHLRVEGVADFALSPGKNYSVAAFVPERKGQPAMVKVFQIPNWTAVLSQKSFYKADRVQLKWNNLGTALLVFAQTDADKTGKSYYGETNLYLMTVAGNYDCRVQLGALPFPFPFSSPTRTAPLTAQEKTRQGRTHPRCVLVNRLEGVWRGVWIHARQNHHL